VIDAQRRQDLWAIATEHSQAAKGAAEHGWHNVSVGCSYYAVYMAMWLALDDPPSGQWSHAGILQRFAPGQWRQPPEPLDRSMTRAIRQLYNARLRAHYTGVRLAATDSAIALTTAREVLCLVAGSLGLSTEGITP
jgi:uncharacterized protein (UPF0332 family)